MTAIQGYKCLRCGGTIVFDSTVQKWKCPFCNTEFEMETLMSYNDGPKSDQAKEMNWQFSGVLKPDLLIPFKVDKKTAKEIIKKYYRGKRLLSKAFKEQNHINEVKGVFIPFWLFDIDVIVNMRYKANKVRTWSDSQYDYTETKSYTVSRSGTLTFEQVPVDGSAKVSDRLMGSINPFCISEGVDYQAAYLADYQVEKFDMDAGQGAERANKYIRKRAENSFYETVKGYAAVTKGMGSVRLQNGKVTYALFPVWILNTIWNGQEYLFVINGQTGKMAGDLPLDKAAYKKWLFGLTGIIGTILSAVFFFFWPFMRDSYRFIQFVMAFGIAFTISLIATEAMRWQLRTIYGQSDTDNYIKQGSMQLTKKEDLLLYRHVERKERPEKLRKG